MPNEQTMISKNVADTLMWLLQKECRGQLTKNMFLPESVVKLILV